MKPKQKNFKDWQDKYLTTLQTDTKNGKRFVKWYIEDYETLEFQRHYLTKAISIIAECMHITTETPAEIGYTLATITELINKLNLLSECEGLDNLNKYTPPECME